MGFWMNPAKVISSNLGIMYQSIVNYEEGRMEESRIVLLTYNESIVYDAFLAHKQTNTAIR